MKAKVVVFLLGDTIAAIATPLGEGGIGIVRMSGDKAVAIARKVFVPAKDREWWKKGGYRLFYGHVRDPETGEVVDEVIFGDVTLAKGFVAIAVVAAWHFANSWAGYRSALVERLTEGQATVLVENGVVKPEALASERMSEEELWSLLRSRGIGREEIEQVKYAVLEPSGALSVIKQEWAKPLEKGDLQRLTRGS